MEEEAEMETELSADGSNLYSAAFADSLATDSHASPTGESLLDSDVMLPAQYFDMCRKTAHVDTGIHRLMLTVLEDGIRCWQEGIDSFSRRKSRLAFHDNEWIFGEIQDGPFSFENICAVLGVDPGWLREGLRRWREAGGARIPRRSPCEHLTRMPLMPAKRKLRRVR